MKCRSGVTCSLSGASPPVEQSSIMGKWHAGIYEPKKCSKLYTGRLLKQFLDDENGKVEAMKWDVWNKPKVGTWTILENTPDHLPDIGMFIKCMMWLQEPWKLHH